MSYRFKIPFGYDFLVYYEILSKIFKLVFAPDLEREGSNWKQYYDTNILIQQSIYDYWTKGNNARMHTERNVWKQ